MQKQPELQQKTGRLQDRVAIVTGSSNGIGQAIALAYAREGALVVVADIGSAHDGQTTASTVDQIVREGGQALFHQADVCDAANTDALVAQAVKTYGRLDM
jgi:NAD(P)-dependent dehydrogenase (short-subunit alcohol dehydrogenase family)